MKKQLLTCVGFAALSSFANAQITPSQTTSGGVKTTIDCFTFDVTSASPTGTALANGATMTFEGNLTGGTFLPDINNYSISSLVSHFNSSGTTTATYSNGQVSFTGSVGLVTQPDHLKGAKGLPNDCRTLDFSFEQCTMVDESSDLFSVIKKTQDSGQTAYFGIVGDEKRSVSFKDAFKYNEKTRSYEYDSKAIEANEKEQIGFYSVNRAGVATEFTQSDETTTIFKDFTVCIECTEKVPEPSSTALLGLGALSLIIRRKR